MSVLGKLHVIAIAKELNKDNEYDVYAYEENRIILYSPQWELDSWNYSEKIRQIAMLVDRGVLDWVDFKIEDGQEVSRQGDVVSVDGQRVEAFSRLDSENFANVGLMSSKIFNEFLRSRDKENSEVREFLTESFDSRFFVKYIADIIESEYAHVLEAEDLDNLDKQIIVRAKIEGYKFIIKFIKNILHSGAEEKIDFCEIFLVRVIKLETQNFLRV